MRPAPVDAGFSLVEMTVATALLTLVLGVVFQLLDPAQGAFRTAPERADVQQRLRAAATTLGDAIARAGAGPSYGPAAGVLVEHIAAVFPYRLGRIDADPPGTVRGDAVTLLRVEPGARQTTLVQPLAAQSGTTVVALETNCMQGDPSCGFRADARVLVIGEGGRFDLFTITGVLGATLTLRHDTRDSSYVYPAGTPLVEASMHTFYLKADAASDQRRLMRYDGDTGAEQPAVEHVAALSFRFRGDPQPPRPLNASAPGLPHASYGPAPPATSDQPTGYPPGENCVFQRDALLQPSSRLPPLGVGTLIDLAPADFSDGPWCADPADPNRYDADLLRVRAVVMTIRIEASAASLRGPAGPLFSRGGTARRADRVVVDAEQTVEFAPVNLFPGR